VHRHAELDLLLHSTTELETVVGAEVSERRQLHIWPFSSVEQLTTREGERWIYKAQREPSVEAAFYRKVGTSEVLPAFEILTDDPPYSTMLVEFVDAPTFTELPLDETATVAHGRAVVDAIGKIGETDGAVPVYIDVGTPDQWNDLVDSTLAMLSALAADGRFVRSDVEDVAALARWAKAPEVLRSIEETSRLTHGDATAQNVFRTSDGYRIIDWQRPQIAPRDVDLVAFLDDQQIESLRHVDPAVVGVREFLLIYWAVEAKTNLLPDLALFDDWTAGAIAHLRMASKYAG
jgi:hypothetical protein